MLNYLIWSLAILASALQVADVISTNRVLALGGYEANKLVAKIQSWLGEWWWVVKLPPVILFIYMAAYQSNWLSAVTLLLIILVYAWVIRSNLLVLDRLSP